MKSIIHFTNILTKTVTKTLPESEPFSINLKSSTDTDLRFNLTSPLQVGDLVECKFNITGDSGAPIEVTVSGAIDEIDENNVAKVYFDDYFVDSAYTNPTQPSSDCFLSLTMNEALNEITVIKVGTVDAVTSDGGSVRTTTEISRLIVTREDSDDEGSDDPTPSPTPEDIMKNLSRNYTDKEALPVKNPIADALDRLTAAFNGSSSDGGESGNVKTATIIVTPSADDNINGLFVVPVFDPFDNVYVAANPRTVISGSEPTEVTDVAIPCAVFRDLVKSISGEYEDDNPVVYRITGDCEIALADGVPE